MATQKFEKGQRVLINKTNTEDLSSYVKEKDGNVYGIVVKNKNVGPWARFINDPVDILISKDYTKYGGGIAEPQICSFERSSLVKI